jgi:hypothetical protein
MALDYLELHIAGFPAAGLRGCAARQRSFDWSARLGAPNPRSGAFQDDPSGLLLGELRAHFAQYRGRCRKTVQPDPRLARRSAEQRRR